MIRPKKQGGSVAIDTVPLPEKPAIKKKPTKGSVAIDTVPLPERNARLATKMLKVERQLGKFVASAESTAEILTFVGPLRKCSFHPHYRPGMTQHEGEQATCDAIESFLDCLAGRPKKPE